MMVRPEELPPLLGQPEQRDAMQRRARKVEARGLVGEAIFPEALRLFISREAAPVFLVPRNGGFGDDQLMEHVIAADEYGAEDVVAVRHRLPRLPEALGRQTSLEDREHLRDVRALLELAVEVHPLLHGRGGME